MARYRHAHRSALLNFAIVGLAAATATLWIARPVLPKPQTIVLHLHPPSQIRRSITAEPPPATNGGPSDDAPAVLVSTPPATVTAAATPVPTPTPTPTPDASPPAEAPAPDAAPAEESSAPPAADDEGSDADAAPEVSVAPAPPPPPPAPRLVRAQAAQTAYLRAGPTVAALIVGSLPPGTLVSVVGCANGCGWLLVQLPGGGRAWSEAYFYSVFGSLAGL